MGFKPIVFHSDGGLNFPELNWKTSISIDIFNFEDKTPYKVFWQIEPAEIKDTEEKLIKNWEFYDLILTWNHNVLSVCPNSVLFPCSSIGAHNPIGDKRFSVSYLISSKTDCPGHRYRQNLYSQIPLNIGTLSIARHRSPPFIPDKSMMLTPFQYSIIMENCRRPNYFTEKILDCFACKTIPIYWGDPNIGNFFNDKGIFTFDTHGDLMNILNNLIPDYYTSHKDVVEENYQKSLAYCDLPNRVAEAIKTFWTVNPKFVHDNAATS